MAIFYASDLIVALWRIFYAAEPTVSMAANYSRIPE
jgi:hypothetical protein